MKLNRLLLFPCIAILLNSSLFAEDEKEKKFPANQWVALAKTKVVIPEIWNKGRHKGINSFGSEVYCEKLGLVLSLDGYTTAPAGKSTPNNYSESMYGFNPITTELTLIKRNNWQGGARSTDPKKCSYPLDENKTEPTPCPRHTYNGICYSNDSGKFYLINGANAGVPNAHPKFKINGGTGVYTFWEYDVETKKWKELDYPGVKRKEPYDTLLRPMLGDNSLYLIQVWSLWKYDLKTNKWTGLKKHTGRPLNSGSKGCHSTVDPIRKRILIFNSAARLRKGKTETEAHKMVNLRYYDVATDAFVQIPLKGAVEGKIKAGIAYVDHMDCYAVRTEKGLFLYFPKEKKWKKPEIKQFIPKARKPFSWTYLNYDSKRKLLILNRYAVLNLDPKTLKLTDLKVEPVTK
ncbi:MAG: hypothetical protein COA79_15595 [Planctomycetota bacterium]|nr:MAG: hypothetical protein COA79_15595 [Planctomycetota bacterium]